MELTHVDISDAVVYASPTKEGINTDAQRLIDQVIEGHLDPIDMAIRLKYAGEVIDKAIDGIKESVIREVEKYSSKEDVTKYGASIKVQAMGVKYNYDNCNHPQLEILMMRKEQLDEEIKEIQSFLKGLKSPMAICNEQTGGETITVCPPVKSSTDTPVIKFKD